MKEDTVYSAAPQEHLGHSRVEYAYQEIKTKITQNVFPAGYQILEPDLAAKLGVSRTPAREALIRLEADGLVELIPRRGMKVIPVSKKELLDACEIDAALNKLSAAALCSSENNFDLSFLHQELEALRTEQDNLLWLDRYEKIQLQWVALAGNDLLKDQLKDLYTRFKRAKLIVLNLYDDKFELNSATTGLVVALDRKQEHAAFAAIDAFYTAFKSRFCLAVKEHKLEEF